MKTILKTIVYAFLLGCVITYLMSILWPVEAVTIEETYTISSPYATTRVTAIQPHKEALKKTTDSGGSLKKALTVEEKIENATMRWFGKSHIQAMKNIIFHESGFSPWAVNRSSGACGLGQALPCSKMNCQLGDADCQIEWVMKYVKSRYQTPTLAWEFWQSHNWY